MLISSFLLHLLHQKKHPPKKTKREWLNPFCDFWIDTLRVCKIKLSKHSFDGASSSSTVEEVPMEDNGRKEQKRKEKKERNILTVSPLPQHITKLIPRHRERRWEHHGCNIAGIVISIAAGVAAGVGGGLCRLRWL